ncbi:hypothetical protein PPYR_06950 [Photinus pyralis]|uniref:DUF5641 domain-containing protein n=2 Tax=Photinus pyralis TaxID=7054 RepID=A0A5N4AP18_PHOPY|nr:hypothetical protein PPYR_06950 [Photinus pyralis]
MEHERLIKKRGSVKAKLTNFQKYVDNLVSIFPQFLIEDQVVFIELKQRVDRFQGVLDEFDGIQGQIELISDDPEAQYLEREIFEAAYYGIEAKAKRFLVQNIKSDVSNSTIVSNETKKAYGVKLPIIEISTYDGEYERWLEFRDTYESLIHQNINLSSVQKFHYLKSYLGPSVLEIIASLELSAINYETAWALICDRFNNSKMLIQNHVKALFNVEKLQVESSSGLRKLVDSVAKHLRALKTLNEPVETWDTLVIYMISGKLDDVTLRKWEQIKVSYTVPTLDNLSSFLKERACLLESIEQNKAVAVEGSDANKRNKKIKSFVTENSSVKPICSFCKQGHYVQNCPEFLKLSPEERSIEVKKRHLCLNCLRSGHMVKRCFSGPCKTCRAKHNTLLHFNSKPDSNANASGSNQIENIEDMHRERVNLSSLNISTNQVLLATVLVDILDKHNKPCTARALLDAGSQSSFLTQQLSRKLQLSESSINIKICGFSDSESECKSKCVARIKSKLTRFWEIEEFPRTKLMSNEERACEDHFRKTFKRDSDNKFIVTIPLVEDPDRLGDSFDTAHKRFLSLERRFDRDDSFKTEYCNNKVLEGIHTNDKADSIDLGVNENTKTLGLFWNGQRDCLFYKISDGSRKNITKRVVLSEISQLFDPLGLLSATIVLAKIILRDIWLERLEWDNSLSYSLHSRWLLFRDQLSSLNSLEIGRRVICTNPILVEMHGFSDASAYAYGACEHADVTEWRHVPTQDNPADYVSRGVNPCDLLALNTYWLGPAWLKLNEQFWPTKGISQESLPEVRKIVQTNAATTIDCHNCFSDEIRSLSRNKFVNKHSKLLKLHPFLDDQGLLRVGGRLVNSKFQFHKRHPIILSCKHPLTRLLFHKWHKLLLHPGPQLLLSSIREYFWPVSGRNLARKLPENRLSHFQQVQRLQQHFWARWSLEYVSELQQRVKWRSNYEILKVGDLVVIKEDNLPPCK